MNHSPLKEGATIHHLPVVRCALPGASCGKQMISAPLQSLQGTLHFPCAGGSQLPLYVLVGQKHLGLQAVLSPVSFLKSGYIFSRG